MNKHLFGTLTLVLLIISSGVHAFPWSSERSELIKFAEHFKGKKYVWNSNGPDTFDCSGFVHFVFKKRFGDNFKLPYSLSQMPGYAYQSVFYRDYLKKQHAEIECFRADVGDVVFFPSNGREFNHIGIISDTRPLYFITAQSRQFGVSEMPFFPGSYWGSRKPECFKNIWIH